jgi:hypothetical protein
VYFLRKAVATAAVFSAVGGASPLAGAESRYEWLVGQLQITEGEQVSYANRAFPKAFSPAEERTGPEGKKHLKRQPTGMPGYFSSCR